MSVKKRLREVADECNSFMGQRYNTVCDAHISFLEKFIDRSPLFATFLEGITKETLIEMLRHPWDIAFDPDQWLEKNKVTKDSDFRSFTITPKDRTYRWKVNTYPVLEANCSTDKKEDVRRDYDNTWVSLPDPPQFVIPERKKEKTFYEAVEKEDVRRYREYVESLPTDGPKFVIDSIPETLEKETKSFYEVEGRPDFFPEGKLISAMCLWVEGPFRAKGYQAKIEDAWSGTKASDFSEADRAFIKKALMSIPTEVLKKSSTLDYRKLLYVTRGFCTAGAVPDVNLSHEDSIVFISHELVLTTSLLSYNRVRGRVEGVFPLEDGSVATDEFKLIVSLFLERYADTTVYRRFDPKVMASLRKAVAKEEKEPFDRDRLKTKFMDVSLKSLYADPEKDKYRNILFRERYKFSKMLSMEEALLEKGEVRQSIKEAYLIPAFDRPVANIPVTIIPVLLDIFIRIMGSGFTDEEDNYLDDRYAALMASLKERMPGLWDAWWDNDA